MTQDPRGASAASKRPQVAAFIGMAVEGLVIDSDHWRHFYLVMAMIWGLAEAAPAAWAPQSSRGE